MIKKFIYLIVFLLCNNLLMGQEIEFEENGLNKIQLNIKVSDIQGISYDKIENHSKAKKVGYLGSFADIYDYYYIREDSMFINKGGLVNDIFFASDHNGTVRGIFLVIENSGDNLRSRLDLSFGPTLLQSTSAMENVATNKKFFWKKNDITVFLTQYADKVYSVIQITNTGLEDKTPGVYVNALYK